MNATRCSINLSSGRTDGAEGVCSGPTLSHIITFLTINCPDNSVFVQNNFEALQILNLDFVFPARTRMALMRVYGFLVLAITFGD